MKRLFRDRKPSIDSKSKPVVSAPAPLGSADTPLYARYAAAQRGQDHGSSGSARPVVSGPKQLSAKASFSRRSANGVLPPNGKPQDMDRHTKVVSRMPSRVARQEETKPKVNPSPSTRYNSQPEPPVAKAAPVSAEPVSVSSSMLETSNLDFPRMQALYALDPLSPHQNISAILPQRSRTESSSSDTSDSYSFSPPPRTLVVRNQDPESDSLPGMPSPARPASLYRSDLQVPSARSSQNILNISSPALQYAHLFETGFDLAEPRNPEPTPDSRYRSPQRPPATGYAATSDLYASATAPSAPRHHKSSASVSQFQTVSSPPVPSPRQQQIEQHALHGNSDIAIPNHRHSLLSSPSVTRKKYSPLAAFGLPVSQAGSDASLATPSNGNNAYNDALQAHSDRQIHRVSVPKLQDLPLLPPLDVSSSSFEIPHLDIDPNGWRKTAIEQASRRASRLSVHESAAKNDHIRAPSPPPTVQYSTQDVDEYGFANDLTFNDVTITSFRPQLLNKRAEDYSYPAPIPIRPPEEPGALSSRLSASLDSVNSTPDPSLLPAESFSELATAHMPDVGGTRFQSSHDTAPPVPAKPRGARPLSYRGETEALSAVHHTEHITSTSRHTPPTQQQNGPIRGRPLIFAAMEATATSEAHNIDVEPEVLGFIGDLSAAAKTEEGYSAYAYGRQNGYQTPSLTPPPPPEKEVEKSRHRKLSNPRRHRSARKVDDMTLDSDRSPARHDSSRGTPPRQMNAPEAHGTSHHRSPSKSVSGKGVTTQQASPGHQEEYERRSNEPDRRARKKSTSQEPRVEQPLSWGAGPSRQPEPQQHQQSRRSPQVQEDRSAAYPPPPHKLSYKTTHPFIPIHQAEPAVSVQTKPTHHSGKPPLSHGSISRHGLPQLPTPPDEVTPSWSKRMRRGKHSPSPPGVVPDGDIREYDHSPLEISEPEVPPEPQFYQLLAHLADPFLLEQLLIYLSFYEWLILACVSKGIRQTLYEDGREVILERYLRTVGYVRWSWNTPEPLMLTVEDLCHYMRGVSLPAHQYSAIATNYLQLHTSVPPRTMQELTFACRAFTRVVLRLRVQVEAEAAHTARSNGYDMPSDPRVNSRPRTLSSGTLVNPSSASSGTLVHHPSSRWASQSSINVSRTSSRAPSPSSSHSHAASRYQPGQINRTASMASAFHSPLFRLRRAPLLQVFVPSPEGDWLSDASILECEAELKRAGVIHLLRAGDVVWDVAVGDEANVGRLVWDGNYLIDLDYAYTRVGDAPRYLPSLAFPPSYFHRVIRTMGTGNPIVRVDISPWADQIHANLQLLQDKMRTDTPQGGRHTVVRWVHRSSFVIRPAPGSRAIRLPMPSSAGPGPSPSGAWVIDPSWFGTIVVETVGTNEGLADLQARLQGPISCRGQMTAEEEQWEERRLVFRILRERSRPGELWIRLVSDKERLLPF